MKLVENDIVNIPFCELLQKSHIVVHANFSVVKFQASLWMRETLLCEISRRFWASCTESCKSGDAGIKAGALRENRDSISENLWY